MFRLSNPRHSCGHSSFLDCVQRTPRILQYDSYKRLVFHGPAPLRRSFAFWIISYAILIFNFALWICSYAIRDVLVGLRFRYLMRLAGPDGTRKHNRTNKKRSIVRNHAP